MKTDRRVLEILGEAKKLAQEYRAITGKPLGVTGEVADTRRRDCSGSTSHRARHAGYDAVRKSDDRRYQIKGRCILPGCKPGQRLGSIDMKKDFDAVLLVLLDQNFETIEIYEAERKPVIDALTAPGSKARNERGQLALSKFKQIGTRVWVRENEGGRFLRADLRRHRLGHTMCARTVSR